MSLYDNVREFVEAISQEATEAGLHAIIADGPDAADTVWLCLRDCAATYPDIRVVDPIQMAFWVRGATIKVLDIQDLDLIRGSRFTSLLITGKTTEEQQQELIESMYRPPFTPAAPRAES